MTPATVSICLHVCVFIIILPTIFSFDIEDLNSNFPAQYGEGSGDDLSGMLPRDDEDGISDDLENDIYDWDPISDGGEGFDTSGTSLLPPFPAPPKTPSQEIGMQCDDGMWIGHGKICNGHADCYDCSDEEDCPYANDNVFMCYGEGENSPTPFTYSNPKCIPLARFCDGRVDCNTGADERQIGDGFRCPVVNRHRQCILPQRYVCDDTVHCEDRSDICPEPWMEKHYRYYGAGGILASYRSSAIEIPDGFFQCLDGKLLISQKQLCDGTLDCADLSDECLCDAQRSNFVENICKGLCAEPVWPDQPPNANCNHCKHGEIYWQFPVILAGEKDSIYGKERMCYSPQEIVLEVESMQAAAKSVDSNIEATQYEIMEFFDANMRPVRARKCDGRPEFVDGSDECGIGCNEYQSGSGSGMESGDLKGKGGDPEFCKLLTGDSETFACLSDSIDDGLAKTSGDGMLLGTKSIVVCDGEEDCADGLDEMFCPKRIPCYANITTPSFDVSQRCDGYSHCPNGKDEDPDDCASLPRESMLCQEEMKLKTNNIEFTWQELIDGVSQCETGSDEAPPYFTAITQVKDEVYGIRRESSQIGISSQDAAIAGVPLRIFFIAISFLGAFALAMSLALGFYNITFRWHSLCKSGSEIEFRDYVIYVREIIINIGVTIAKGLLCGYFAYVIITRREESNYAGVDLKWRSSKSCSIAGTVALLGCQLPVLSLAVFAVASMIFDCVRRASQKKDKISTTRNICIEEAFPRRKVVNIRKRVVNHVVMVLCCVVLIAMIYWPIVVVIKLLHSPSNLYLNTATYGWVVPRGAPQLFRANLLNQDAAKEFVSKAAALSPDNPSNLSRSVEFSFDYFSTVANSVSENFKMETIGSFGYFSQSGSCLPAFLVHATGGEAPYDIAVSNRSTVILSAIIVAFNFVLIFFTGAVTTRYGSGVAKTCSQPSSRNERLKILDRTFSRLVIIEMATWAIITLAFLLKSVVPDIATDRAYATLAIVVLGLNCGVATPAVMLLRKFRVRNSSTSKLTTCSKKSRKRQNSNDSRRIIEASDTSQEREHFTEEDKSRDSEPSEQPDESDSLVQHADDVEQPSTTK